MTHLRDRVLTCVLGVSAVVLAATSVRRAYRPEATSPVPPAVSARQIHDWESTVLGSARPLRTSKVVVVEYSDLECPFCKRFHQVLRATLDSLKSNEIESRFIHYPLPQHRFALPAARAVECARTENKFGELVDEIFRKQDSLGLKSWGSLAMSVGIADTAAIARCAQAEDVPTPVEEGLTSGKRIGVSGTPTVLVNGWLFSIPPYDSLGTVLGRALRGEAYRW